MNLTVRTSALLVVVIAIIAFASPLSAQEKTFDDSALTVSGRQAYQSLLKVKLFAIGGTGYSGEISNGERSFDLLLSESHSLSAFRSLVKEATIEGGMYGLLGLMIAGCDCYNDESSHFLSVRTDERNKESFKTQSGCLVGIANSSDEKAQMLNYLVAEGFEQFKEMKLRQRAGK